MPHWTQRDAEQKPMMAAAGKPTASQGTASGHDRAANARTWGRAAVQWTPRPRHRARGQAWVSGLTVRGATPAPGARPAHGGHSRPLERLPLPGAPSRASAYLLGLLLKAALLKPMLLTRVTHEETEASKGSVTHRMFAGQKSSPPWLPRTLGLGPGPAVRPHSSPRSFASVPTFLQRLFAFPRGSAASPSQRRTCLDAAVSSAVVRSRP